MLTVLIFLFILSFLVFVHELGHYLAAKRAGVRVEEFGLGIPPRLLGKKVGETVYSINLLPFGGFVRLTGEDIEHGGSYEQALKDPRSFLSKKASRRALILVSGVLMNILFGFIFYYILIVANGFKSSTIPVYSEFDFPFGKETRVNTVVTRVEAGSPAETVGISFGEAIIELNDIPVYSAKDVRSIISESLGRQTRVLLMDVRKSDRPTRVVDLTPEAGEDGRPQMGVLLGGVVTIHFETPVQKILSGPMHASNMVLYSFKVLSELFYFSVRTGNVEPVYTGVSGPVGVFSIVGEIVKTKGKEAVLNLIDLTALLSLSLAIMNLLPFPALDGGRVLFVVFEMVSGRRINPSKEALLHKIGMLFLLGLMVLITIKDVRNLI